MSEQWRSDPGPSKTIAERVRYIADGPHPWIPGGPSGVAFLKEIAAALEQREAIIALLYEERRPKTNLEMEWEGLRDELQALLGINACPFDFSHTRVWCGFPMCGEA